MKLIILPTLIAICCFFCVGCPNGQQSKAVPDGYKNLKDTAIVMKGNKLVSPRQQRAVTGD